MRLDGLEPGRGAFDIRRSTFDIRIVAALVLTACCAAAPAAAQFAQYTSPGDTEDRPVSRRQRFEAAMEEARWRLGPVRLEPWLGIRDIGWVDNLSGREGGGSDLTATAGAGLKAYLPTGPKVVWAAHFLPEYVWFQDTDELSELNGRYGVGFFGFFNRLQVEATTTRSQQLGIVSSELLARINSRADELTLGAEIRIAGSLHLFATGSESSIDHLDDGGLPGSPDFDLLDRTERVTRAGLRFRTRRGWSVGLGAERSEVDFEDAAADRSSTGTSPVLVVSLPGEWLFLAVDLALRSLEPEGASSFVAYDGVTGTVQASFGREGGRLQPTLYLRRNLVYSAEAPSAYFEADRAGAVLAGALGWRTAFQVFAEVGENDHAASAAVPERADDVTAAGIRFGFTLARTVQLNLGYSREEIDSEVPGADRSVSFVQAGITLGAGPSPWY